jgi:dUTP pyrophosphatase
MTTGPEPDAGGTTRGGGVLRPPSPGGAPFEVPVKLLSPKGRLPRRAYEHDAAFDLHAAEDVVVPPLGRALVGTGIALGLPPGLAALTLPRSGLATRHGISLVNAPGLIDPGYRGEVRLVLLNTDTREPFAVRAGDRVAQLLFVELPAVALAQAETLDDTARGAQGFGSSGSAGHGGEGVP